MVAPTAPGVTDWERAYRRLEREYAVLPRTGLPRGSKLRRFWYWASEDWFDYDWADRVPDWLADPIIDLVARPAAWLCCLVHNHTPFTEMDNRTIVCAICRKRLGTHE